MKKKMYSGLSVKERLSDFWSVVSPFLGIGVILCVTINAGCLLNTLM